MGVRRAICQLRTTDLEASLQFYVDRLGFEETFRVGDFYAGVRAGESELHLKLVDDPDPSIPFVHAGRHLHLYFPVYGARAFAAELVSRGVTLVREPASNDYATDEFVVDDNQGHRLYFAEANS